MTSRYLRYALAVIFFANFLSYLDRQVVSALEKEIRQAFHPMSKEAAGEWRMYISYLQS